MIKEMMIKYTGSLAEQVVNGVTNMVIRRSFQFSMFRVAMMAGMAQAVPEIDGHAKPFHAGSVSRVGAVALTRVAYGLALGERHAVIRNLRQDVAMSGPNVHVVREHGRRQRGQHETPASHEGCNCVLFLAACSTNQVTVWASHRLTD